MRQIKFRAWDKEMKRMRTVVEWTPDHGIIVQDRKEVPVRLFEDEYILMQFTGLLDKNGKEIYEGDVVKIEDNVFPEKIYRLEWANCSFYLCYKTPNSATRRIPPYGGAHDGYKLMEIIGNIYENPELLK